jgi:preprotein translocase subunit SecD
VMKRREGKGREGKGRQQQNEMLLVFAHTVLVGEYTHSILPAVLCFCCTGAIRGFALLKGL